MTLRVSLDFLGLSMCAMFVVAGAAGCSDSASTGVTTVGVDNERITPASPAEPPRSTCARAESTCSDNTVRVLSATGDCVDIVANDEGRWRARPLFPDAPSRIRASMCAYAWEPGRCAFGDVVALAARLPAARLACNATSAAVESSARGGGERLEAPFVSTGGCDTCAMTYDGVLYVTLPVNSLDWTHVYDPNGSWSADIVVPPGAINFYVPGVTPTATPLLLNMRF
jgi:hypothetical protein